MRFPAPPTDQSVTVGLVGLGYWGPNLLRVLAEMEDVDVKMICDVDGARLARFARRYPGARPTTRFEDLLEDPEIDVVVIATPVFTHFDLASRSIAAGKHTFVEKPLASSSEDADMLIDAANEADRVLVCGHTFLYSPPVRAVRRLLELGELGEIFFISSSRVNLGLHQRDISVIWDLGPHDFSILLYWLGEMPETIQAVGRDSIVKGIPDVAFLTLRYASGLIANLELSWLAPSKLRRTAVVGSKKMVVYEDGIGEPLKVFDHGVIYEDPETFGEYQLSYRTGDVLSPKLGVAEPITVQMEDFLATVRSGQTPEGQAQLARDVVCLAERAEQSLAEGGVPLAVNVVAALRSRG